MENHPECFLQMKVQGGKQGGDPRGRENGRITAERGRPHPSRHRKALQGPVKRPSRSGASAWGSHGARSLMRRLQCPEQTCPSPRSQERHRQDRP